MRADVEVGPLARPRTGGRRSRYGLIALLALLVLCDSWLFRRGGVAGQVAWPLAYAGLCAVYKIAGLDVRDVGLSRDTLGRGAWQALLIITAIAIVLTGAFLVDNRLFRDPRYHQPVGSAVLAVLIALPLKVVLFEELAFRGILLALLRKLSNARYALLGSAALFGLWHLPTAGGISGGIQNNHLALSGHLTVLLVFIVTATAGWMFGYLRQKSGSLLLPMAAHWAVNAVAMILAALSWQ